MAANNVESVFAWAVNDEGKTILLYYDPIFLEHVTGNHPENAARILPALQKLNSIALNKNFRRPNWPAATKERICRVHDESYVNDIMEFAAADGGYIEQDTVVGKKSYEVALMAAGAICNAVDRIDRKEDRTAFCLVRPPGHHAMADHAMGFCLFNNVAIGARVATEECGYERVLIIDWDVHHGNGTQATFWEDAQVAYFSIHRDPFYPFTGAATETGAGSGAGTIKNLPIQFGTPRTVQLQLFERELAAFTEKVRPQLIFISAGFDAHKDDPIGSLELESEDFAAMTRIVRSLAETYAEGRIISVLEGGYNPNAVAECIDVHLTELSAVNPLKN